MVRSTLALAAVLAVASTSLAADLVTPGVAIGSNSGVDCRLVNITSAPLATRIQLISGLEGKVLVDSGPITVGAGSSLDYGERTAGIDYCRFVNTSKSKVRAALVAASLSGDGSNTIVAEAH